jgi:hypothetical protein
MKIKPNYRRRPFRFYSFPLRSCETSLAESVGSWTSALLSAPPCPFVTLMAMHPYVLCTLEGYAHESGRLAAIVIHHRRP